MFQSNISNPIKLYEINPKIHWEWAETEKWKILTLCGAFNNRCIPGSWVQMGTPSLKLKIGGLEGSGKLVLLNGSVSSKYWTLQSNAMPKQPGHTPSREASL